MSAYERTLPFYLKENITANKLKAVDFILADEGETPQEALVREIKEELETDYASLPRQYAMI